MKIGCLQFAPQVGEVKANIQRAERLLLQAGITAGDLDLLVLPELAFSGYNFPTLEAITPFLEPTEGGVSTQWAQETAKRLQCKVLVGFPEKVSSPLGHVSPVRATEAPKQEPTDVGFQGKPVIPRSDAAFPHNYNTAVIVDQTGTVVHRYRKSHLYYTDTIWSREGSGFAAVDLTIGEQMCRTTTGICMDLNNKNFTAPWTDFEFANSVVESQSQLAVVSMAWLSQDLMLSDLDGAAGKEPHLETVGYWAARLQPVVDASKVAGNVVIAVFANRSGTEGDVNYAGSSTVMAVQNGSVAIFDVLGKGEERLLVVNTATAPKYRISRGSQ